MRKSILFFTFLFSAMISVAQESNAVEIHHYFSEGDTLVLSNGGHIRSMPSRNGKSLDQLPVGSVLYINAEVDWGGVNGDIIYNLKAGYYPVRYEKAGQWKSGYVWGGLIARAFSADKNGNRYIYGQRSFNEATNEITAAVIRIDGKTNRLNEQLFSYEYGYRNSFESKILSGMGLRGLEQIFRVGILGEACGIYTTYYYYGWNGEEFIELPTKNSMGDAGVFGFSENLLFPAEHKKADNLIIIESTSSTYNYIEYKEIKGEIFENEEVIKEIKVYLWDGKSARLLEPTNVDY